MALFKFTTAMILEGTPIDIYNHGGMYRDFTYFDDLDRGIGFLVDALRRHPASAEDVAKGDSFSPVAPYPIDSTGNSDKVRLQNVVDTIENKLRIKTERNFLQMRKGDVFATWANASLL